jgi:hypothetical protein
MPKSLETGTHKQLRLLAAMGREATATAEDLRLIIEARRRRGESLRRIAATFAALGVPVSATTVKAWLEEGGDA